ncbi:hypothetical protein BH09MYX1_BH09MYX1_11790 [soil metagenome]
MKARLAPFVLALSLAALAPADVLARPVEDAGALAPSWTRLAISNMTLTFEHVSHGTYRAGSEATDPLHEPDEQAHDVTLTKDFDILVTPVTFGQFDAFVNDTGYVTEAEHGTSGGSGWNGTTLVQKKEYTWRNPGFLQTVTHPVVLVTYADALAFVSWVSAKSGKTARLPTEAEYEYATRGGTTTAWYTGDDESAARTIGAFETGHGTEVAMTHVPNAFGLYDMSGNVYEWCSDVYAPYSATAATDPRNEVAPAGEPLRRVLRGGSWLKDPKHGRSAARYRNTPGSRNADNGFRVVLVQGASLLGASPLGSPTNASSRRNVTPPSADDERSHPGIVFAIVAAALAAIAAVVFWMRRESNAAPSPASVTFTARADGFTLQTPGLGPGSRVRYDCVVNGVLVSDVVPVGHGPETFVYTGGIPSTIRILDVAAVTVDVRGVSSPVRRSDMGPSARRDDDDHGSGFGGFPSAY